MKKISKDIEELSKQLPWNAPLKRTVLNKEVTPEGVEIAVYVPETIHDLMEDLIGHFIKTDLIGDSEFQVDLEFIAPQLLSAVSAIGMQKLFNILPKSFYGDLTPEKEDLMGDMVESVKLTAQMILVNHFPGSYTVATASKEEEDQPVDEDIIKAVLEENKEPELVEALRKRVARQIADGVDLEGLVQFFIERTGMSRETIMDLFFEPESEEQQKLRS